MNAGQAERDRLVEFWRGLCPAAAPGGRVRCYAYELDDCAALRFPMFARGRRPDRHPMGHRPKDEPANYGRRIDERGGAIVYYTSAPSGEGHVGSHHSRVRWRWWHQVLLGVEVQRPWG